MMDTALLFLPIIIIITCLVSKKNEIDDPWFSKYFDWGPQVLISVITIVFIQIFKDINTSKAILTEVFVSKNASLYSFLHITTIKEFEFMLLAIAVIFSKNACTINHYSIDVGTAIWNKVHPSFLMVIYSILCLFIYYYFLLVFIFGFDFKIYIRLLPFNDWLYYPTITIIFFCWPTLNKKIKRSRYSLPKSKHFHKWK